MSRSLAAADSLVQRDIPYLGGDRAEKMDAWLPPESFARPVPAVLLIHGGGWRVGDKADPREESIAADLNAEGIAVFSINYLLNKETADPAGGESIALAWPQNIADCKSAFRYLRKEASRFGLDPDRIAVMGGSAGGHLSMLVGLSGTSGALGDFGLYPEERNDVACIVNLYGIHDVRRFETYHFEGATPAETERNFEMASPISYLTKDSPPIFVTHGTADEVVSVDLSRDLVSRLADLGVPHEYIEIPEAPHSYDLKPEQFDLRPAVLSFLRKHLGML